MSEPSVVRLPFLFAMQMWSGDCQHAFNLLNLICDIQIGRCDKMDVMLCYRPDVIIPSALLMRLQERFNVLTHRVMVQSLPWPKGPNGMAHEIYNLFHYKCNLDKADPWKYCAIMMAEPDSVPMTLDWISKLQDEWYTCDWNWPLGNRQMVLGCWQVQADCGCPTPHINGNCMISPEFKNVYKGFEKTTFGAWDTTHSKMMTELGRPSKMIFSDYNIGGPTGKQFMGCSDMARPRFMKHPNPIAGIELRPVWLHGIKDLGAIKCARQIVGLDKPSRLEPNLSGANSYRKRLTLQNRDGNIVLA